MERSEQALVPEWLRSAGSVSSGGSSTHHFASSSSHSDAPSSVHHTRNRNSKSKNDIDTICSPFLDRSSSANSRGVSSGGSAKHAYSSFNRSHRGKDRDREKDRLGYVDPWDHDSSDPLGSIFTNRDKDQLRRSHSMVSREQVEIRSQKVSMGFRNVANSNQHSGNGILPGPIIIGNSFQKTVFEKDFPSLGNEDRHGFPDVARVSSPGISSAVQSLPVGNSALIGGEGWTSALAEVPNAIEKSGAGLSPSSQSGAASTGTSSGTPGLNMAEALVQAPPRTRTPPQSSVKTQRLEELAIKQSRQLIPVTPSMPKGLVLNSSDKSKTKPMVRTGEIGHTVSRSAQQQPSILLNPSQFPPGGQIKSDPSSKKLLVLKPSWENGVTAVPKDGVSPTNNNNANGRATANQFTVVPSVPSAPLKNTNSPKERKPAALSMKSGLNLEKRPSLSQTRSRNDFFNFLKQKTNTNIPTDSPNSSSCITSSSEEKPEGSKGIVIDLSHSQAVVNGGDSVTVKDNSGEGVERLSQVGEKNLSFEAAVYPDEEEAAFLRSLGWEENPGEDEGLTEEEISSFIERYNKLSPSQKQSQGMLPKLSVIQETTKGMAPS